MMYRKKVYWTLAIISSLLFYALLWQQLSNRRIGAKTTPSTRIPQGFVWGNKTRLNTTEPKTGKPITTKWNAKIRPTSVSKHKRLHSDGTSKPGITKADQAPRTTLQLTFQKDNFQKVPQWDFDDVYRQDPHPRQTTCQESLRNSEDPKFKEAFIPNIQLFMHQEHLNLSEWKRLAHFNNPFGFMGYNYTDIKPAVDLIPKLKDYQLLPVPPGNKGGCIRCAVVGTGGILNGSRMGREIDSHDYVFRMNGAIIEGYEEDVGNKTSVYVHTAYSLVASLSALRKNGFKVPHEEGIKYVMIPEGLRDYQWLRGLLEKKTVSSGQFQNWRYVIKASHLEPWRHYGDLFDENRFYVLHPDFLRYVRNRFLKSKQLEGEHWGLYRPTNGAFTLFLALHTCDIVDAYGFITADHQKYHNYYFERFQKTRVVFYINHDYNLEIKTWKNLNDAKIIRLYQREEEMEK